VRLFVSISCGRSFKSWFADGQSVWLGVVVIAVAALTFGGTPVTSRAQPSPLSSRYAKARQCLVDSGFTVVSERRRSGGTRVVSARSKSSAFALIAVARDTHAARSARDDLIRVLKNQKQSRGSKALLKYVSIRATVVYGWTTTPMRGDVLLLRTCARKASR
jgi:hypothetical protein